MRLERVRRFSATLRRLFLQKSKRNFIPLILILVVCIFTTLIYTFSGCLFSAIIGSKGRIETLGVGVYWDKDCSNPVFYIDWGLIEPGSIKNIPVHIRNEANVPTTILLGSANWDPADASDYITLDWDYSGQVLERNETVKTTLKLLISSSVQNVTDFNVDIVISQYS